MALLKNTNSGRVATPVRRPAPVTYPTPPRTTTVRRTTTPSRTTTSRTSTSRTSTSRASTSRTSAPKAVDPYAQARADQKAAEQKAATRLTDQAARLKEQAEALRIALSDKGLQATLNRELANADLEYGEEDSLILAQYKRGKETLEQQAGTTEDNRARTIQEAGSNANRERNEALMQGIENGIGASDMLKAQAASLRNWSFNMAQVQANYTDEINGLQSEHAQMVNSVVTSRQAAWREREQQRSQLYRGYYDNRGQVLTEIGNKLGESSQYFDMANEQVSSSTSQSAAKDASQRALEALREAAQETGKSYAERAAPGEITGWQGTAKIVNSTNPRQWAQQTLEVKDAEGAKLRRWEA